MSKIHHFDGYYIEVKDTLAEQKRWENGGWGSYQKKFKVNDGSSVGKINLNTQYCFGSHRSGWAFVLESLAHLHNDQGLFFNSFIESNFAWVPYPQVYKEKWSGFVHNPPNTPDWFFGFNSLEKIISKPQFQQSIENCVGLFTLSQDLADYV